MTATCPLCGCDQAEGLLCHNDTTRLERELGDVAAIVGELDTTMSKQAKMGNGGKAGKGSTHEKWPINMGAVEAGDNLGNVLTTWARDVDESPMECTCGHKDLPASFHMTPCPIKVVHLARLAQERKGDQSGAIAARILLSCIPAIRRHAAVVELVDEITDAIAQARRAVDRPADRQYLGQCLVETPDDEGRQVTCLAELYARQNASEVRCKVCGAEHPVVERRAWLMERAADMIVTVKEASSYLGEVGGIKVTESSIRGYLHRGTRLQYRAPIEAKRFRLGDLLAVVLDESERKGAA